MRAGGGGKKETERESRRGARIFVDEKRTEQNGGMC